MPYTPNSWLDGPAGGTPITAATLTHLETQYTNAVTAAAAYTDTVAPAFWKPATAYVAGQLVVSPGGDLVSAKTSHTSGGTFTAANWNLSSNYVAVDATKAALSPGMSGDAHNVAIGAGALAQSAAGALQVAVGYQALNAAVDNGTGIQNGSNVAVGPYALQKAISNQNTAVGAQALQNLVGDTLTGISNNAFGDEALLNLVSGNNNNAFGVQALAQCTAGSNSAFGHEALQQTTTGASNSAFGYLAGLAVTTGNQNTILGNSAAYQGTGVVTQLTTGSNNVFVGSGAGISGAGQVSLSTVVGKGALVGASQTTAIGAGATASNIGSIAIGVDSTGVGAVAATNNLAVIGTAMHTVQVANLSISNAATQTTAPAAGGAAALPATPAGYISITIAGTVRKIPYY